MQTSANRARHGPIEWALAAGMAALVVVVIAQVLLRYLTDQPLAWTEEAARFLFLWCCFLGAAAGSRRGAHFAIDTFTNLLVGRARLGFRFALRVVEAGFFLSLAWSGFLVTRIAADQHSSSLDLPMSVPYAAIPVCSAFMAVLTLTRACREARQQESGPC